MQSYFQYCSFPRVDQSFNRCIPKNEAATFRNLLLTPSSGKHFCSGFGIGLFYETQENRHFHLKKGTVSSRNVVDPF